MENYLSVITFTILLNIAAKCLLFHFHFSKTFMRFRIGMMQSRKASLHHVAIEV